jgi:hypothetical protein
MHRSTKLAATTLILALTLSACGGGDDNNDSTPASSSSAATSSAVSSTATSSAASSAATSSTASSTATSSTASSATSSAAPSVVLQTNFQTLASGLTENVETTIAATSLPTVLNSKNYAITVVGKLKMIAAQALPSVAAGSADLSTWSVGVVQFSNNTSSIGKVAIAAVQCPFTLAVNHAPANTTEATRKLRITFGGSEVYYDGGAVNSTAPGYTASINSATASTPCTSGTTDVEIYGWDGTQGKGVRVYDLSITQ